MRPGPKSGTRSGGCSGQSLRGRRQCLHRIPDRSGDARHEPPLSREVLLVSIAGDRRRKGVRRHQAAVRFQQPIGAGEFDDDGVSPACSTRTRTSTSRVLALDSAAIVRAKGRRAVLALATATPAERDGVPVIHHPVGLAKKVSLGCAAFPGSAGVVEHTCGTWGGSSGAPLIGTDGKVVALHFAAASRDHDRRGRSQEALATGTVFPESCEADRDPAGQAEAVRAMKRLTSSSRSRSRCRRVHLGSATAGRVAGRRLPAELRRARTSPAGQRRVRRRVIAAAAQATDVFVFSHGWWNNPAPGSSVASSQRCAVASPRSSRRRRSARCSSASTGPPPSSRSTRATAIAHRARRLRAPGERWEHSESPSRDRRVGAGRVSHRGATPGLRSGAGAGHGSSRSGAP